MSRKWPDNKDIEVGEEDKKGRSSELCYPVLQPLATCGYLRSFEINKIQILVSQWHLPHFKALISIYMWLVFTILGIITESSIAEHCLWTKRKVKAQSPKSICWGNNCRWLSTAAGQAIQRRYPGDEAGGTGQCRQLMVFLGLYYKM